MTKSTFRLLETVLCLSDEDKKKCLPYFERAQEELNDEVARLKGEENAEGAEQEQ